VYCKYFQPPKIGQQTPSHELVYFFRSNILYHTSCACFIEASKEGSHILCQFLLNIPYKHFKMLEDVIMISMASKEDKFLEYVGDPWFDDGFPYLHDKGCINYIQY
jgi:hypothetical protein